MSKSIFPQKRTYASRGEACAGSFFVCLLWGTSGEVRYEMFLCYGGQQFRGAGHPEQAAVDHQVGIFRGGGQVTGVLFAVPVTGLVYPVNHPFGLGGGHF